jgi:hypothetical protein
MTVLIYVNISKQVGDADHLKVFANADAAETWLEENDPEGVAFEYEVLEWSPDAIHQTVVYRLSKIASRLLVGRTSL